MAAGPPLVRFQNVRKSYDGRTDVVRDLTLDLQQGEFLTMLGPSGSGKTTSLMMLAGFEHPTAGEIVLAGAPINRVPPNRRGIGMVFQSYALFPHMTVAENLAFPLKIRQLPAAEIAGRVRRSLDMVRMGTLGDRRPAQLSGGQQQRIALARALIFEPRLVLMDEPLGALDRSLREEMQMEIKALHQRLGVSVVYVTHDQGEALTMSTRVAVFDHGVVQQVAPPQAIYEEPANIFVARFVGDTNCLAGTVRDVSSGACRVEVNGAVITALPVMADRPGQATTLALRPERVRIDPAEGSLPNIVEAVVRELTYFGDHIRVRAEVCGNDQFIVRLSNDNHGPTLGTDGRLRIGWAAEDCRAL